MIALRCYFDELQTLFQITKSDRIDSIYSWNCGTRWLRKGCGNGWHSWISGAFGVWWILFCREIEFYLWRTFPLLQPKSECLCPENFPRALINENGFSFYCVRNHQPGDDKIPRHVHKDGGRLILSEYLTDGVYEDVNKGRRLRDDSSFFN